MIAGNTKLLIKEYFCVNTMLLLLCETNITAAAAAIASRRSLPGSCFPGSTAAARPNITLFTVLAGLRRRRPAGENAVCTGRRRVRSSNRPSGTHSLV